ncbi:MAG: hypothetical protein ACTSPG_00325 [Candidatus Hodarchaeales archaeon]
MDKLDNETEADQNNQTTEARPPSSLIIRILATIGLFSLVFGAFNLISIVVISLRNSSFSNVNGLVISVLLVAGGITLFIGMLILNHTTLTSSVNHDLTSDLSISE